jgi:hypothetical protein
MSDDRFDYELAKLLVEADRAGIAGAHIVDSMHRAVSRSWCNDVVANGADRKGRLFEDA